MSNLTCDSQSQSAVMSDTYYLMSSKSRNINKLLPIPHQSPDSRVPSRLPTEYPVIPKMIDRTGLPAKTAPTFPAGP